MAFARARGLKEDDRYAPLFAWMEDNEGAAGCESDVGAHGGVSVEGDNGESSAP